MATPNLVLFALTVVKKTDHQIRISRLIYSQNILDCSYYIRLSKGLWFYCLVQFYEIIKLAMLIATMFHSIVSMLITTMFHTTDSLHLKLKCVISSIA